MDFWLSIAFPYCWQTNNILNYPTRCAQYPQLSVLFLQPALSRVALVVAHLVNEHMAGVIVEQPYQCKIDFITPAFSSISKCHFPEVAVPSNSQQILHHFFPPQTEAVQKVSDEATELAHSVSGLARGSSKYSNSSKQMVP